MKRFLAILFIFILMLTVVSCASKEKDDINVTVLAGPTGMGAAKLMNENTTGNALNNYNFTVATSPDEVTAAVINGSTDIAAVPANLASVLFNKTNKEVQVIAVNTLGVLYMLENGNTINSINDLRGKTIYATGQASTPEYILRHILIQNDIDPDKDVTIEYYAAHAELATVISSGDIILGMLPEPNVSAVLSANPSVRIALNLTDEWNKISGDTSMLIQGCVIVNKAFAEANKKAVDNFLTEYKKSIDYVNANISEAAQLIADNGILSKAAIVEKAIPNSNIVYIDGDEMKEQLSGFLEILFNANPASVGGTMPDDTFYYKK
ncbi:MAG: ABC transporter substrate-binding protein [Eubacteriales bacterium]